MPAKSSHSMDPTGHQTSPVVRGVRRRDEIVATAETVFLKNGYTETTMQEVAVRAGASKETLYRHFGSKEGLFAEVMNRRAQSLTDKLDAGLDRPKALADALRDLGIKLLEQMTSPEVTALLRIVVAEAPRDPTLGRIFYSLGPERTRAQLAEFLAAARDRGEFRGSNPGLAASIFLGAVIAMTHTARLVLQDPPPLSRADIEERVDEVVAMFLLRHAPSHCPPASAC